MKIFLAGYYYALSNYLNTDKGKHDAADYLRAVIIIIVTAMVASISLRVLFGH